MIDIKPIERVNMTQRVNQIRQRITEIEEKIGIGNGDFQARLEREIARQSAISPVQPTKAPTEIQPLPGTKQPVNDNDAAISAKVAQALRDQGIDVKDTPKNYLPGQEALPGGLKPQTPQPQVTEPTQQPKPTTPEIKRRDIPDTEPQTPERDDKIFQDNYIGKNAEVTPTEDLIMQTAYQYGVDPKLVRAIAIAESNMNQEEISDAGAIGVMQLMPSTAAYLGVNPYDKDENIDGGTRFIREMLDTFDGDVPLAVAAYNAGPGAVKRYGGIPPYPETQHYVNRVMDLFM